MNIEIICIGNELLIGKIENTNAHWLAQQTTRLGANAILITVSDVFCECSIFADDNVESRLAPLIDWVMADNVGVYVKFHPLLSEGKLRVKLHLTMVLSQDFENAWAIHRAVILLILILNI